MEKKSGPIRALQLMFIALLCGQLLFAALTLALVKTGIVNLVVENKTERIFEAVCLSASFICVWIAFTLFKRKLEQARSYSLLANRFNEYRTACVVKYALLEMPTLLCIIFYFLTGKWNFIIMAVILIFIFMSQNPIRARIKIELQTDDAGIDEINNLKG
ncbi:MAG TPA: hypothetical protein VFN30_13465 [Chitinophagaceae bacterium]|nr:hypothetical protein [Chitinophagaceae bacterium]